MVVQYQIKKRLIHDTGHYGNNVVQTIIKDTGGYGVKVTRLLGHFLDYGFYKVFRYKLKLCKAVPKNSTELVEIGLLGSKLGLILSILCTKNSLN